MENLLRDPFWTFVGVIMAFLAIIVTVLVFFAQCRKKQLSYEIISNIQLLGVDEKIAGKGKVLDEGNEVKNVHLLSIKLTNTGNQPILSSDFERPFSISINHKSKILTHEIFDTEPSNIGAEVELIDNSITLKPLLLNPKDSISIKAIVSDYDGNIQIDGRVCGVKDITKRSLWL